MKVPDHLGADMLTSNSQDSEQLKFMVVLLIGLI